MQLLVKVSFGHKTAITLVQEVTYLHNYTNAWLLLYKLPKLGPGRYQSVAVRPLIYARRDRLST